MIAADLARANERVATVERRNVRWFKTPGRQLRATNVYRRSCSAPRSSLFEAVLPKLRGEFGTWSPRTCMADVCAG
jgi:hypothetical protein